MSENKSKVDTSCESCGAEWSGVPAGKIPLENCPLCDGTIDRMETSISKALRRREMT